MRNISPGPGPGPGPCPCTCPCPRDGAQMYKMDYSGLQWQDRAGLQQAPGHTRTACAQKNTILDLLGLLRPQEGSQEVRTQIILDYKPTIPKNP